MSVAVLNHAHAIKSVNSASVKPGLVPGSSVTSADTATFLGALDQALGSRQGNAPTSQAIQLANGQNSGQNLPLFGNENQKPANNSDPIQMLMAQFMAQGLTIQNTQSANQANSLNSLQQFDPNQASMISLALAKALRSSGKDLNSDAQNQAASLLASLQAVALNNQSSQDSMQSLSQIASAIQTLAQKNGLTLPADLQQRLSDLISLGNTGSIKLLGIQAGQSNSDSNKFSALDLAKSNSAQNLADAKAPKTLSATIDKLQKGKTLETAFGSNGNLATVSKSPLNKVDGPGDTHLAGLKAATEGSKSLDEGSQALASDLKSSKESPSATDLAASNPFASGLVRTEAQVASSSHTVAVKASELSLASGPLHTEVMSAAKSGGGRIMLELTPPEQGTIRIDLHINQNGQAHLIVEGASDATKSRLDQGGQNLKNEFAQMGLNLSLDLRQGSGSQQARDQGFSNARQSFYANANNTSQSLSSALALTNSVSGDNSTNSSTVHLYA